MTACVAVGVGARAYCECGVCVWLPHHDDYNLTAVLPHHYMLTHKPTHGKLGVPYFTASLSNLLLLAPLHNELLLLQRYLYYFIPPTTATTDTTSTGTATAATATTTLQQRHYILTKAHAQGAWHVLRGDHS
jgi:hypothetical protein